MKSSIHPLGFVFAAATLLISLHVTAGPKPQQNEAYRVDVNNAGATLSLFKLFTIQPAKKNTAVRQLKNAAPKAENDKREDGLLALPLQDRIRR